MRLDGLRARILAGQPAVGTFLNLGSAVSAEICAASGYDWVLVDLEHGSGTTADLLPQLQAVTGTGAVPCVRVELSARTAVSRALDAGAEGVMLPRLDSLDEVREAIRYLRFPPAGIRGVATQNRAGRFGEVALIDLPKHEETLIGIVQIETLGSLRDIEDIAHLEGVDVLFVGPGDLSYALGVPGRVRDPRYLDALDAVVKASRHAGCAAGILVPDLDTAVRHLELGFRFVAVGSDSASVRLAAMNVVRGFQLATEEMARS